MIPVILCGGAGTRLWPVSRDAYPKPFIRLANGPSLLQGTLNRCASLADGPVFVVTNEAYAFKVRQECEELDALTGKPVMQLLEPMGRNTAPAVALAALAASTRGEDPTLLVLPADHLIPDVQAFQEAAQKAAQIAARGDLVLFGISPTAPETGFGYIQLGKQQDDNCYKVNGFVEKPNKSTAEKILAQGDAVWNSGMFCFKASAILNAMEQYAPETLEAAQKVYDNCQRQSGVSSANELRFDKTDFADLPDISIDYAVMEHAQNVMAVKVDYHWSDIGSWKAVAEQMSADVSGNTTVGECLMIDSRNSHVQSDDRLIATIGVDDLVVIDTPDAILVAKKDADQQVKEVVSQLKSRGHEAASIHRTVVRPWGTYSVLHEGSRFKMKEIVVYPGQTLSLQMHHHRAEHWIVISGTAKVTCGDEVKMVYGNQSTYIPVGTTHRLENPGKVDVVMIEVQCGDYVGEDDIVRFDDRYGRVQEKSTA